MTKFTIEILCMNCMKADNDNSCLIDQISSEDKNSGIRVLQWKKANKKTYCVKAIVETKNNLTKKEISDWIVSEYSNSIVQTIISKKWF